MTPLAEAEAGRAQVLAAELFGWSLSVWGREGGLYDARLAPPDGSPFELHLWPGLPAVVDSLANYLGPRVRLAPAYVRAALVAVLDVEMHA